MRPSGFAAALVDHLGLRPAVPPELPEKDRAVALARAVLSRDGDMMLTGAEAAVVSRQLLAALGLGDRSA